LKIRAAALKQFKILLVRFRQAILSKVSNNGSSGGFEINL
jgi:hypothetical protein